MELGAPSSGHSSLDPTTAIGLFFVLLFALMFFAGTEIPLMSVANHKIDGFIKQGRIGAKALKYIKRHAERLLIVNLIGTTIVTVWISSLATVAASGVASLFWLSWPYTITICVLAATVIILLFGEIAPKVLGVRFSDSVALKVAPIYRVLMWILTPLNWMIEWFTRFLTLITGGKHGDIHSHRVTSEEVEAFLELSEEHGVVEEIEHRRIKWVLDLADTRAESVMTPRVQVEFISLRSTVWEALERFFSASHTRLPAFGESPDDIDYVVSFRKVVEWHRNGLDETELKDLPLEKIIKIPLTKRIDDLMEIFQKSRKHIALVLDEHGGVAGVVTMEDVIEEVFGDIKDEKDDEEVYIRHISDGSISVVGNTLIEDILEECEIGEIEEIGFREEHYGEAISYLIIERLERFPREGEVLTFWPLRIEVDSIDDGRIERVSVSKEKK